MPRTRTIVASSLAGLVGVASIALFAGASCADQRMGMRGDGWHGGGPGGFRGRGAGFQMLRLADANGDRQVTRAEVETLQTEMFTWLDRTGDGQLDIADRSPIEQRARALREQADEGDEDRRERRRGRRGMRADANEDGAISFEEFSERTWERFDELDEDGDGVVTPEELDAAVANARDRRVWWRES